MDGAAPGAGPRVADYFVEAVVVVAGPRPTLLRACTLTEYVVRRGSPSKTAVVELASTHRVVPLRQAR